MKVEQEFVSADIALKLKDLGFDKDCFGYYNIDPQLSAPYFNFGKPFLHEWCLPAPLYQQAFRWFRERHLIYGEIMIFKGNLYSWECYKIADKKMDGVERITAHVSIDNNSFSAYEEAEFLCLQEMIKIVKESKL
jgi:hypothetical protein